MSANRTTIISSVISAISASGVVGARVHRGRRNEVIGDDLPEIYVYPMREEVDTQTMGPTRYRHRTLPLQVDYHAKAASAEALEQAFDTAGGTIETAVLGVATTTVMRDVLLTSYEWTYDGRESEFIGTCRISFNVIFSNY